MNFIELLRNRRSIRRFKTQPIEAEKIELLKKAVLMSPSGKRVNEWEFIIVQNPDTLHKLSESKDHGSELIAGAPLAIVVLANNTLSDVWIEDTSIASIILQLEAEALGLGSCWVQCRLRNRADGTKSENYVRQLLNIPEEYSVESIIAIGYKDQDRKPYEDDKLLWNKIHNEKF